MPQPQTGSYDQNLASYLAPAYVFPKKVKIPAHCLAGRKCNSAKTPTTRTRGLMAAKFGTNCPAMEHEPIKIS